MTESARNMRRVPTATSEELLIHQNVNDKGREFRATMEALRPRAIIHIGRVMTARAVFQESEDVTSMYSRIWLARASRNSQEPIELMRDKVYVQQTKNGIYALTAPSVVCRLDGDGFLTGNPFRGYTPSQQLQVLERTATLLPIIQEQILETQARNIAPKIL